MGGWKSDAICVLSFQTKLNSMLGRNFGRSQSHLNMELMNALKIYRLLKSVAQTTEKKNNSLKNQPPKINNKQHRYYQMQNGRNI